MEEAAEAARLAATQGQGQGQGHGPPTPPTTPQADLLRDNKQSMGRCPDVQAQMSIRHILHHQAIRALLSDQSFIIRHHR